MEVSSKRPPGTSRELSRGRRSRELVEHGQDASDQEDRVADHPEDGQAFRHDPRRQQGRREDEPGRAGAGIDGEHVAVPASVARAGGRAAVGRSRPRRAGTRPSHQQVGPRANPCGLASGSGASRARSRRPRGRRDEQEQANDEDAPGVWCAPLVGVDERVADGEGEGSRQEEQSDEDCAVSPCRRRGRDRPRLPRSGLCVCPIDPFSVAGVMASPSSLLLTM